MRVKTGLGFFEFGRSALLLVWLLDVGGGVLDFGCDGGFRMLVSRRTMDIVSTDSRLVLHYVHVVWLIGFCCLYLA